MTDNSGKTTNNKVNVYEMSPSLLCQDINITPPLELIWRWLEFSGNTSGQSCCIQHDRCGDSLSVNELL
jgi:hypothetical protein